MHSGECADCQASRRSVLKSGGLQVAGGRETTKNAQRDSRPNVRGQARGGRSRGRALSLKFAVRDAHETRRGGAETLPSLKKQIGSLRSVPIRHLVLTHLSQLPRLESVLGVLLLLLRV